MRAASVQRQEPFQDGIKWGPSNRHCVAFFLGTCRHGKKTFRGKRILGYRCQFWSSQAVLAEIPGIIAMISGFRQVKSKIA
jgi:hypothetical protein